MKRTRKQRHAARPFRSVAPDIRVIQEHSENGIHTFDRVILDSISLCSCPPDTPGHYPITVTRPARDD